MTEESSNEKPDKNEDEQKQDKSAGNTGFMARRQLETEKHNTGSMF